MSGISVTVCAYGATGSGKTFTMMGAGSPGLSNGTTEVAPSSLDSANSQDGLTQMMLKDLCKVAQQQRTSGDDVRLQVSYVVG